MNVCVGVVCVLAPRGGAATVSYCTGKVVLVLVSTARHVSLRSVYLMFNKI